MSDYVYHSTLKLLWNLFLGAFMDPFYDLCFVPVMLLC